MQYLIGLIPIDVFFDYSNAILEKDYSKMMSVLKTVKETGLPLEDVANGLSNHFRKKGKIRFRSISLCSNVAAITATANDYGYRNIFKFQLEDLANKGDVLVIFSVSGSSDNIIEAAKFSKKKGLKIVAITGFSGGKVKKYSNVSLDFDCKNYGMVEDLQMMLINSFCEKVI